MSDVGSTVLRQPLSERDWRDRVTEMWWLSDFYNVGTRVASWWLALRWQYRDECTRGEAASDVDYTQHPRGSAKI